MRSVILEFFKRRGGHIYSPRLQKELAKYEDRVVRAKAAGKSSAFKKANKNNGNLSNLVEPKINQPEPEPEEIIDTVVSKSLSPTKRTTKSQMDGFDGFWAAYPRKVAKGAAERAYAKALSVITDPDPPSVLRAAAERFAASDPDPQFTPHPATWLNSRRWEDEPDERSSTNPNQVARGGPSPSEARRAGAALAIAQRRADRGSEADDGGGYPGAQVLSFRG